MIRMNRNIKLLAVAIIGVVLFSCQKKGQTQYSFYHWKAKAKNAFTARGVDKNKVHKIYMHYFDVDELNTANTWDDGIYPVYPLTEVDTVYQDMNIVPVVFVVNKVLKNTSIAKLANKIQKLVDEISMHHFQRKMHQLQIDCDWSVSSKDAYFALLTELEKYFEVSATIRLHQIKYKNKTGVPPVSQGVLMLYNVGDLADFSKNSILDSHIVASYIDESSAYPIPLDIALPLFSQTVLKNNSGKIKLIKGIHRADLKKDRIHFKEKNAHLFWVEKDTLYKGFYLSKGNQIKLEEITKKDIIQSYDRVKNSEIKVGELIFYHLDTTVINQIEFRQLLTEL